MGAVFPFLLAILIKLKVIIKLFFFPSLTDVLFHKIQVFVLANSSKADSVGEKLNSLPSFPSCSPINTILSLPESYRLGPDLAA